MAGAVTEPDEGAVAAAIRRLAGERGAARSVCPSEVARASPPEEWRPLMGAVRRAAARLARGGEIEVLRAGRPVDPDSPRGAIWLRIVPR